MDIQASVTHRLSQLYRDVCQAMRSHSIIILLGEIGYYILLILKIALLLLNNNMHNNHMPNYSFELKIQG